MLTQAYGKTTPRSTQQGKTFAPGCGAPAVCRWRMERNGICDRKTVAQYLDLVEDICLKVGEQVFLSWKKRTVAVDGLWI